jgi:hypothetical protein
VAILRSLRHKLEAAWLDVRDGLRVLARTPAFSLTALTTLALAIGVNVSRLMDATLARLQQERRAGSPHSPARPGDDAATDMVPATSFGP